MTPPLATGMPQTFRRATSHLRRGIPFRKRDGAVPFSGKTSRGERRSLSLKGIESISQNQRLANRAPVALERQTRVPTTATPNLKPQIASPRSARYWQFLPASKMVGELPTCLWFAFHTGLVPRATAPTAKTTRNARDSVSVGPISSYISIGLLSAAAQNEHRANQYAEKESCFHFEVSSLSNSGPDARFSTYHLSVNLFKSKL